jgi:hypothetical protein
LAEERIDRVSLKQIEVMLGERERISVYREVLILIVGGDRCKQSWKRVHNLVMSNEFIYEEL